MVICSVFCKGSPIPDLRMCSNFEEAMLFGARNVKVLPV